jgi:hypothetical protein
VADASANPSRHVRARCPGHQRRGVLLARGRLAFTEDGNRYEGEVEGRTLTFVGPARFQYDLDASGRVKTNDDGTHEVTWWLRDESGEFKPWMNNVFSRER